MNTWLSGLQVGDRVIVGRRWPHSKVDTVERLTQTLIVLRGGGRFRRVDGTAVGSDTYSIFMLCEPTQKTPDEIKRSRLEKQLAAIKWGEVSLEDLLAIESIITGKGTAGVDLVASERQLCAELCLKYSVLIADGIIKSEHAGAASLAAEKCHEMILSRGLGDE